MKDLIHAGMEREAAYRIMESVRRGRGLSQETADTMRKHGIPEWYIEACRKIKYLFPRAHAAAYVTASLQLPGLRCTIQRLFIKHGLQSIKMIWRELI